METAMLRLAVLLWLLIGITFAGSFILGILSVPVIAVQAMRVIPFAAVAGFAIAIPLAVLVARAIVGGTRPA
jgi:hypothetical protein